MSVFPEQKSEYADSEEASAHLQPQTFLLSFASLTRPSRDSSHDCAACLGLDESDGFLLELIRTKVTSSHLRAKSARSCFILELQILSARTVFKGALRHFVTGTNPGASFIKQSCNHLSLSVPSAENHV